ncbi:MULTISPECIES: hypothetical protein [Acetobacter]|uniref:Uncharacterized protein n=1 Tax=Acetobacter lovaniensis TaxID=104100 RepID=A0A841QFI6_9PROT|nr:hypothetical protein [Acetobacter lovaniensis]MBB6457216.1 hypothetical protein [Acetobacter lovaniensis]NHN81205.1 hypothetical protein [Acetobacter lovaniensis]GBQ69355.1 hypothetical protein AA0474_1900 [Acetobacter lovaniensis NRIC 0474]
MSNKPTGVFVRFPLSEAARELLVDAAAFGKPDDSHDKAILAIGTPVTGGELEVAAYDNCRSGYLSRAKPCTESIKLVRQSDAQAQIAALEAEVVRLRHHLERIDRLIMGNSDPVMMFCGIHASCTKALKGGAA